jgi:hypothetical protein
MDNTHSLLPHWVTPLPIGERTVDALGLSAVLDACAEDILPGISGSTKRARYWSFFSWARTITNQNVTENIHKWEVSLARGEHLIHNNDDAECSWIGKKNIKEVVKAGRIPRDPRQVWQNPGWMYYRPAMVAAKLIENKKPYLPTSDGVRLSRLYMQGAKPPKHLNLNWSKRACLSNISDNETKALRKIIGFSSHLDWDCQEEIDWDKRRKTVQALKSNQNDAGDVLLYWRRRRGSFNEHTELIARASGWVSIAFGMTALLVAWIYGKHNLELVKAIKSARSNRHAGEPKILLDKADLQEKENIHSAFSAIRSGLDVLDRIRCNPNHKVKDWAISLTSDKIFIRSRIKFGCQALELMLY